MLVLPETEVGRKKGRVRLRLCLQTVPTQGNARDNCEIMQGKGGRFCGWILRSIQACASKWQSESSSQRPRLEQAVALDAAAREVLLVSQQAVDERQLPCRCRPCCLRLLGQCRLQLTPQTCMLDAQIAKIRLSDGFGTGGFAGCTWV